VGPFDTLAGFVLSLLGRIPVAGDDCTYDGWALTVVELDGRRVATVRVERSSAPAEDGSP
jgi:CBS domain containing-hemolysin-like protein